MTAMTFQTVERDSFFTRLDFRPKLVMMVVVSIIAFVWESPLAQALLAGAVIITSLLAGVKWSYIRMIVTIMTPFYALLLITHGFFNVAQVQALTGQIELTPLFTFPASWPLIGGGAMSLEGVLYGINVICKTLTLVLVIPLGIFTTEVDKFIVGMVKARVPYKLAFIFSATLRFVPLLLTEIQSIIEAQRLRGLAVEKMGLTQRVRVYAKVAVPLILGAMVKSQMLEVVLQSKAFTGTADRTYLHDSTLRLSDYLMIAFFVLFFVVAVVAYVTVGFGKFGGLL
jgi:energy-coupling factor transport system permease protein